MTLTKPLNFYRKGKLLCPPTGAKQPSSQVAKQPSSQAAKQPSKDEVCFDEAATMLHRIAHKPKLGLGAWCVSL
ncbi:hypothetical protein D3C75_720150 [compost metagenome]|uniref:hypothetical protein n=1 Tax=Pseudomonas fluorescens TaxID=294 RepID=UPI000FB6EEDD|nr:hypothetical protein [Pseudomonas fluorescens]VVO81254.1 hypothetical protein PS843_01797 [Pseudomonas fluorescens]